MRGRKAADTTASRNLTRREALGTVGATGALVLAGCSGGGETGGNNDPTPASTDAGGGTTTPADDVVRIGMSIPLTGTRKTEGKQLRAGYRHAAKHINEGKGAAKVKPFTDIGTDGGLLGKTVELVTADTQSTGTGARKAAQSLVKNQSVTMFTGGATADEGINHQRVAKSTQTMYMGGFTPTEAVSGRQCTRYGFNEMYNAKMAADSLAKIVGRELGLDSEVTFAQLYPDSEFGNTFVSEMESRFGRISSSWSQQARESTRKGERDFTNALKTVLSSETDLLVLNYYGLSASSVLRSYSQLKGFDPLVVVPVFNRQFANSAGDALKGVYGTAHWPPRSKEGKGYASGRSVHPFRTMFLERWGDVKNEFDTPPPISHLAYVQLCQYAAAVARAGTLKPDPVIKELEGHTYDYGGGEQTLRACDHQAARTVPVVRGLPLSEQAPGEFYKLSRLQSALSLGGSMAYDCDEPPARNCSLN